MVKNPPANAGDRGSNPGPGRHPALGHGSPFQHSCLENSMHSGTPVAHGLCKEPPRPSRHAVSEDSPSQEFKSCSPKCLSSGLVKGRVECIAPPRAGRGGERERDARRQLVMKLETRGIRSLACIALQIQRAWVPSWVPCPSSYPKQSILNQKGI